MLVHKPRLTLRGQALYHRAIHLTPCEENASHERFWSQGGVVRRSHGDSRRKRRNQDRWIVRKGLGPGALQKVAIPESSSPPEGQTVSDSAGGRF